MVTQCTFNNGSCLLRTEGLAFKPGSAQICPILINLNPSIDVHGQQSGGALFTKSTICGH